MTAQDIIDLLPIVAYRFERRYSYGVIRDCNDRCPICSLVDEISPNSPFYSMAHTAVAGLRIPLGREEIERLVVAADYPTKTSLRRAMLAALEITE